MKSIAVINAVAIGEIASRPVADGRSSIERAVSFAKALPGVAEVVFLASKGAGAPEGARVEARDSWTVDDLLAAFKKWADGSGDIFYFFADCPLMDRDVSARMYDNHRKYYADYTYADGYPYGIAPEILRGDVVERLQALASRQSAGGRQASGRELIFDLIKADINSFDVETELAPQDQRLLRVSLTADTERNYLLIARIAESGGRDAPSIARLIGERPEILRTLPAFFPIQIVERCPQACSYCPYPKFGGDILHKSGAMPIADFSSLVDKISRFCGDAVIDISLWGEPSFHPKIEEIVHTALSKHGISLVIETSGIGWNADALAAIARGPAGSLTWILSLDASEEGVYRSLRGDGFAESRKTAQALEGLFPGRVYVQAVRMKENEEDIEKFYRTWKEKEDRLIIQKYDGFSGFLPDRKLTDLSPLRRFPCWHLKRDFPILLDGTVSICREDLGRGHVLGNALGEEPAAIWAKGEELHRAHIQGSYPHICSACDEWYTYNF